MVPIDEYTTLSKEQSIQKAVFELKKTFTTKVSTGRLMETGHRSILVMGAGEEVTGILTIKDLLEMSMPAYLSAAKSFTADSIQYSPMFWSGMFSESVKQMAQKKIEDVMDFVKFGIPITILAWLVLWVWTVFGYWRFISWPA